MKFDLACLALAATAIPLSAQPKGGALPTVDEIVARHLEATGGPCGRDSRQKLARVSPFRSRQTCLSRPHRARPENGCS
jgi:hypothetical protein